MNARGQRSLAAPCVTCRCTLTRHDLADGRRCSRCPKAVSWSEPIIVQPTHLPWWSTGSDITWSAALLLFLVGVVVLVGGVAIGQDAMCQLHDDRLVYCAGYAEQQP